MHCYNYNYYYETTGGLQLEGNMEPDSGHSSRKLTLWLRIWTKPRETIREIIEKDPNHRFYVLSAIYGFPLLLNFAQSFSLGFRMPVGLIVLLAVIFATFIGMLGISVTSGLLYLAGRCIQGKGSYLQVRASVAWSNVPSVAQIVVWAFLISFFGMNAFDHDFAYLNFTQNELLLVTGLFLLQSIAGIWSFFILLFSLAEVQKFSAWKALLNIALPVVAIGVVVWGIGFLMK